jgi:hypothetical protein
MNRDTLKGQWTQLKGKVRERGGELTDDDLTLRALAQALADLDADAGWRWSTWRRPAFQQASYVEGDDQRARVFGGVLRGLDRPE